MFWGWIQPVVFIKRAIIQHGLWPPNHDWKLDGKLARSKINGWVFICWVMGRGWRWQDKWQKACSIWISNESPSFLSYFPTLVCDRFDTDSFSSFSERNMVTLESLKHTMSPYSLLTWMDVVVWGSLKSKSCPHHAPLWLRGLNVVVLLKVLHCLAQVDANDAQGT